MQSSDPRLFSKALAAFQSARYDDAERDFKKVLRGEPKHFGALNLYAILLMQTGRIHDAEPLLRKAVTIDARSDASFYNFGLVLKRLKKPAEALEAFTKSIALKPGNAETWNNRGAVFNDLGRYAEAIGDFDQALALNPAYAEAMSNRGRSLLLTGRYEESAAAYDHALKISPNLPEAWIGQGAVHFGLTRWREALAAFETAIRLRSDFQEAWVAAGESQIELGLHNNAVRSFETAIGLGKDSAAAWLGLANAFNALGQTEKAVEAGNNAIKIDSKSPEILIGHGNLLAKLKHYDDALAVFESLLKHRPDFVDALIGRGNVFLKLKKYRDAVASYDAALVVKAICPGARLGRGTVFNALRRFSEASAEFDQAIEINPNLAEAWFGRAIALMQQREFEAATSAYRRTLDLRPDFAEALTGYGHLLNLVGQRHDALGAYDRAIKIDPTLAEAWLCQGYVQNSVQRYTEAQASLAEALRLEPDIPFAKGNLLHVKALNCDWANQTEEWSNFIADIDRGKPVSEAFPSLSLGTSPAQQLVCVRLLNDELLKETPDPLWRGERYSHERIRVAYLSSDFQQHPLAYLSIGLFEHHDHARFETIGVSVSPDDKSPMRARMQSAFDHFIDGYRVSNREIARMLREREVDILVDLGGHTSDSRIDLLAWRPAPVQATYLGYPGTTGLPFIDYLIADPTVIPPDQQQFYSEKVAYLPDCYLPNDRARAIGPTPNRADAGLPPTGFVFCSFNQPFKITPTVFDVWMRLLAKVQGSVLWLPKFTASARANLCKEAVLRGIPPERIIFAERVDSQEDHLARLRLADLFLDTPGYNAHSTACDALWIGLPLITCIGSTFAGRVGASALNAVGLPELIVTSLADYEALAVRLATNPALLGPIRDRLVAQRLTTPLFDTERFTRNLEAIYLKMWQRTQAGEVHGPLSL